jgi:hypothetical protein
MAYLVTILMKASFHSFCVLSFPQACYIAHKVDATQLVGKTKNNGEKKSYSTVNLLRIYIYSAHSTFAQI